MKQLDQERKKKKGEEKMQVDSDSTNMSNMQEKDLEIKTDDLVVSYLYDVIMINTLIVKSFYCLGHDEKMPKSPLQSGDPLLKVWSFFSIKIELE